MKRHQNSSNRSSFIFEILIFVLILFFIIIPPIFVSGLTENSTMFSWTFPWRQAGFCAFCIVLYFFTRKILCSDKKIFYISMLCLCLMLLVAIILKLIGTKTVTGSTISVQLPQTAYEGLCCFLLFAFGAVYEEIIYRYYFVDTLKRILGFAGLENPKLLFVICEGLGLILFACGHIYLGLFAVINAAFAHVILRILYKKTGLIWNGVLIHFIYNMISMILL